MVRLLTAIAALVTILAMGTYLYINSPWVIRIERVEAPKVEDRVITETPPVVPPFGPVPYVVVKAVPAPPPAPVARVHAPARVAPARARKPTPRPRPGAASRLKSNWVVSPQAEPPQAEPFSLEKLFNVR